MSVADNVKPYPDAATYETWKRAQTKSVGDKISTGLGEALSKARGDYSLIKWEMIDVKRYEHAHGALDSLAKAEVARRGAQTHFKLFVTPAIKSLKSARTKAIAAGTNVIISKARNAEAKKIAKALDEPIRVLDAIHLNDFDAAVDKVKPKK